MSLKIVHARRPFRLWLSAQCNFISPSLVVSSPIDQQSGGPSRAPNLQADLSHPSFFPYLFLDKAPALTYFLRQSLGLVYASSMRLPLSQTDITFGTWP